MKISASQKDYSWNTLAGVINAAEAVIMSMIVTRTTNLADAGMLSIAFAIGNLLMAIGKYGMRTYQVTDFSHQYRFGDYFLSRLLTAGIMLLSVFFYIVYAHMRLDYDLSKIYVVLIICLIYVVEALEDVFWGYYQQEGHLADGAKIFCIRWLGILICFGVTCILGHNMLLALWLSLGVSIILFIVCICLTFHKVSGERYKRRFAWMREGTMKKAVQLLGQAFPLFGVTFLSFYVINSPKYAIDKCMNNEVQACYGFIAMPVFAIGLLNSFIYQPTLVAMAEEWNEKKLASFRKRIGKQGIIIAAITALVLIAAYFLGIPILSWLYNTDLTNYKIELLTLLLAGGFLAGTGYLTAVLTTMRMQKYLFIGYVVVALLAFCFMNRAVGSYGILGGAIYYCLLMFVLCIIYLIMLSIGLIKGKQKNEK